MRLNIKPILIFGTGTNYIGEYIIVCRLYVSRKKTEFSTGIYASKDDWDKTINRTKSNHRTNVLLSEFEARLQEIVDRMYYDNVVITGTLIKEMYTGKSQSTYSITEYFNYYLYDKGNVNILAKGYFNKFITLRGHLERFTKKIHGTKSFDMRSVDFKFLTDFDIYMKSIESEQFRRPLSLVYINKMHSMFRTITISARKEKVIKIYPYHSFKIRKVKTEIKYLTVDELKRLNDLDLSTNLTLDRVKDAFMFSVYTGLRYNDAQDILESDIEYVDEEPKYLIMYQKKTKDKVEIPILKPTLDIINKYEKTLLREDTGRLIPKISNVKINYHLKRIGDLANIKLKLTHHVARHTCATSVLLENNVPLNEVSKWLGHREMKSTSVYAHVTRDKLGNTAERLNELL